MVRKACFAAVVVLLACKGDKAAPDAGTAVERGTDLRNAITTLFPEYRGALLGGGRAALTRSSTGATSADLEKAKGLAAANGFTGDPPQRRPFVLEQTLDGGVLTQQLAMGLSPDELGRIVAAPASMSTEAMANWLPKTSAQRQQEQFELELIWVARDVSRADFLVWQLVDGALSSGWTGQLPPGFQRDRRADGGAGEVPADCTVTVKNAALGATIEVVRKDDRARLRYVLSTFERR